METHAVFNIREQAEVALLVADFHAFRLDAEAGLNVRAPAPVAARPNVPVTGKDFDSLPAPADQAPTEPLMVPPASATAQAAGTPPTPNRQQIHHAEQVCLWKIRVAIYQWRVLIEVLHALKHPGKTTPKLPESGRGTAAYIKLIKSMENIIGPIEGWGAKTSEELRIGLRSVPGENRRIYTQEYQQVWSSSITS